MSKKLTIIPEGKHLTDLVHEVDTFHKDIKALGENEACICWQSEGERSGTLVLFDYEDGYPYLYWQEGDEREKYTSLARFIPFIEKCLISSSDEADRYLMTQPVWVVAGADEANREAINNLLGDIEIDL